MTVTLAKILGFEDDVAFYGNIGFGYPDRDQGLTWVKIHKIMRQSQRAFIFQRYPPPEELDLLFALSDPDFTRMTSASRTEGRTVHGIEWYIVGHRSPTESSLRQESRSVDF